MKKAYQVITDRIIDLLERGTVPWQKPWGGQDNWPKNLSSGKKYRGVNVFVLGCAGYESPYWLTFKQARERGGHVKKGEKGYPCIFWNWHEREDPESGLLEKHPFLRYYTVFNVAQCEDVDSPAINVVKQNNQPIEECVKIVQNMPNPPRILHGATKASYSPMSDSAHIPDLEAFKNSENYYCTLFHELAHSTGHDSRLGRVGITQPVNYASHKYSREELIAEMGATFLCGHAGIENKVIDNSAAYIDFWLGRLRKDNRMIIQTASQAQKAADYIIRDNQDND